MEMSACCLPEQAGHLEVLQGRWSKTDLLVEGPDSGDVVVNATCGEAVGEVSDVQAHSGDVCIEEVEMVVITELDERLCL